MNSAAQRPTRCADVRWIEHEPLPYVENIGVGALLWDPKGGEGHVIVDSVECGEVYAVGDGSVTSTADCGCGGHLGSCASRVLVCECGEDDSFRDHHYEVMQRGD